MLKRYAREVMSSNWGEYARYKAWLDVELAVVKGWNKLGLIPDDDANKILKNAKFDVDTIEKIEEVTKHDLIAFTTCVSQSLGKESRWFHYGMTSSDTVDTAVALQIKNSINIIIDDTKQMLEIIKIKAYEHKDTLMVGRSHGIHGEPITFGLVLGVWYDEVREHLKNLKQTKKVIGVGQISGAMGNFAHTPLELEEYVCKELGLKPAPISNQVIGRDRYARLATTLALLASSVEKFAVQIRHWQRTEVYECEEFFAKGQKGSSAMPHKRNPILTENITGLARIIRAYSIPAMENVALWHERDISHSSTERFWLPDAFITCDFMLNRMSGVIKNLTVMPKNMIKNLNLTGGLVFSQRVLLELAKYGLNREVAYKIVQQNAMRVWEKISDGEATTDEGGESLYLQYLLKDKELGKYLNEKQIRECFDFSYYTKNVDSIFKRVFK
jgi:adenylosuccinate lyase